MTNILTRIQSTLDEIGAFARHNNLDRLINAMRELKSLGAEAMISGNVLASKNVMSAIRGLPFRTFQVDLLNRRFLAAYLQEFEPTPDIVAEIKQPTLSLHQRLVSTLIENGDLKLDDTKRALCASMAKQKHFSPLAKMLDALFIRLENMSEKDRAWEVSWLSESLALVSEEVDWSLKSAKVVVNVFVKHSTLLTQCIERLETTDSGEWNRFSSEALIRLLHPCGCPSLVESLFHQYAMKKVNVPLIDDLVLAGIKIDSQTLAVNLEASYRGTLGVYALTAMELHLCSGGQIPLLVDFKQCRGLVAGKFINARLRRWGELQPEACLSIAHTFLDNNPDGKGLFSQPLPRILVERSERLRADSLSSDLGL